MFDAFRRFIGFLAGLGIVLAGLLEECPRPVAVLVGLLLMGVFTVPEAMDLVKGKPRKEDE